LACCGLAIAGCARTVTWKEEVQLSDGRVIVVERETLRVPGGDDLAHGGSGSRPKERRIRFEYPFGSGQQVEWRSIEMPSFDLPEIPLVLDIQQGMPYVMTAAYISDGCNRYLKYVYVNGQWREEPLAEEFEAKPTNLLLMSGPNMPSFVDLATKVKDIADIRYAKRLKQAGPHKRFCHG
jgi:hypothetical protein